MILAIRCALLACMVVGWAAPASAQAVLDRAPPVLDPSAAVSGRGAELGLSASAASMADASVVTIAHPSPGSEAVAATVTVGAVRLEGLKAFSPADFADMLAEYSGREMPPEELQQLANGLATFMRGRGYVFASAHLPPQAVSAGLVRVTIDEGILREVRVVGGSNRALETALAPLVSDDPVTLDELERRLLIAGDIPGVTISDTSYVRENGDGVLVVTIAEERVTGSVQVNNYGTRTVGPVQMQLAVDVAGLLGSDDRVTFNGIITPVEPEEFGYGQVRYATRIGRDGTEVSLTGAYSYNRPGAYLRQYDLTGSSWYARVGVLHPLLRRRTASLWFQASLDVRGSTRRLGTALYQTDRLAVLRTGFYADSELWDGRLQTQVTLSRGIDAFGATERGDIYASHPGADGTFTSVSVWSSWMRTVAPRASVRLATQLQVAFDPLLVSEEVGLGGPYFGRGYDYSERTGDSGLLGLAEFRYNLDDGTKMPRRQLYTYFDGGVVDDLHGGFGDGSLMSAGGGMRVDLDKSFGLDVQMAVPLSGSRYDTDDAGPELLFNISSRF